MCYSIHCFIIHQGIWTRYLMCTNGNKKLERSVEGKLIILYRLYLATRSTWSGMIQLPYQVHGIHGPIGWWGMIFPILILKWSPGSFQVTLLDHRSGKFLAWLLDLSRSSRLGCLILFSWNRNRRSRRESTSTDDKTGTLPAAATFCVLFTIPEMKCCYSVIAYE